MSAKILNQAELLVVDANQSDSQGEDVHSFLCRTTSGLCLGRRAWKTREARCEASTLIRLLLGYPPTAGYLARTQPTQACSDVSHPQPATVCRMAEQMRVVFGGVNTASKHRQRMS